jgi:hypothetical protein
VARPDAYVCEIAFASNPDDDIASQVWTDVARYLDVQAGVKISRGRTDEFGEIQPSKLGLVLDNRDGRFTPDNSSSPYAPNVKSGKKIRLGLLWKGNGKQVVAADPSFESTAGFGWATQGGLTYVGSATQVFQGAQSMRVTLPTAGSFGSNVQSPRINGLVIGRTYTASIYVYVPTGTPVIQFRQLAGGATSNTSTNNAFQRLSVTFVATANNNKMILWPTTASTAGQLFYVDAFQVEEGAVATAFEPTPAVFSYRFTGDVVEFPLSWSGGPAAYAETNLTAVDRLSTLGELGEYQTLIKETILQAGPVGYWPLDEGVGASSGGDISGNSNPPMTIGQVGAGGTATFGWDHTDGLVVGDYAVPDFYKDRTTGVQFLPSALGTPITAAFPTGKFLRSTLATPISGAAGASVAAWACYPSSGASAFGPIAFLTAADGSYLGCHKSATSGFITAIFVNQADGAGGVPWEVTVASTPTTDFNINYAAILSVPSAGQGLVTFVRNGSVIGTAGPFAMPVMPVWSQVTFAGRDKTVDGVARLNGSHVQAYDYAVPSSTFARQFFAAVQGRTSSVGADTTSIRAAQLLAFRNLAGTPIVFTVLGVSPASIGPQEIEGNPVDALHLVEDTEGGILYIDGAGVATLQLRNYRYNTDPVMTLAADRLDPDAISFRGDAFGVRNDVTASRPDGASVRFVNAASVAETGRRKASVQAIPQTDDGLASIAARQAVGFGTQRNRITSVKISLLNDRALIPGALALDIGSKLGLTALPVQAPAATASVFVEGWDEVIGEQEWSLAFNTSPSQPWDVWQLGVAGRSELGVTTVVAF